MGAARHYDTRIVSLYKASKVGWSSTLILRPICHFLMRYIDNDTTWLVKKQYDTACVDWIVLPI
jgi:hypothetical protein